MAELKISSEVLSAALHSHIRGLGLDKDGRAKKIGGGLVGQEKAREAAGIVVKMIKYGRLTGKGILLAGPPGTGKTAIAIAIARELGEDTPFVALNASEVYSLEKKKTEVLMQAIRRAIGVRVRETRRVLEGVVTELKYLRRKSMWSPYPQLAGVKMTLETKDDSMSFTAPPEVAAQLLKLGVKKGDVIIIDAETLDVRKVGKAKGKATKLYDLETDIEVEIPSGSVEKTKEVLRTFTLHDIDLSLAAQRAVFTGLFAIFGGEKEISDEVRRKTDEIIKKWIEEKKAELVPGVLFIDDAHLLDLEVYSFITKAMESDFAPIIILATNRGITKIRGTDIESPHGMPRDLLDRLLIIPTRPYTEDEIREIIRIRSEEQEIPLSEKALEKLTKLGVEHSLRYALQLLEPSRIIAESKGRIKVEEEDVETAAKLFADVKTSVRMLEDYKDLMLY